MESMLFAWAEGQSWWGTLGSIVVVANALTMALKDEYAEKIPFLGKLWPIMNWLALNVHHNNSWSRGYPQTKIEI